MKFVAIVQSSFYCIVFHCMNGYKNIFSFSPFTGHFGDVQSFINSAAMNIFLSQCPRPEVSWTYTEGGHISRIYNSNKYVYTGNGAPKYIKQIVIDLKCEIDTK